MIIKQQEFSIIANKEELELLIEALNNHKWTIDKVMEASAIRDTLLVAHNSKGV